MQVFCPRPYPQTFRLGWKGLPGTKALAHYEKS